MDQHAQPGHPAPAESFPTDPSGLPEATRPALLELADGDDLHLQIGPWPSGSGHHGADAGLQRLHPRPDPQSAAGLGGHRPRHQRRRPGNHRALARAAAGEQYNGVPHETQTPIPVGGSSPTGSGSPTPACTGTTRTSARTTPRRWACTATSWSSPPTPVTGRPPTAMSF